MSIQTFPFTPTSDLITELPYGVDMEVSTVRSEFANGAVQTRPRWRKPRRRWSLSWGSANNTEAELLQAFYREVLGPAYPFYLELSEMIPRPFAAPTLAQVAGGALGARTRYAAFTWSDGSGETRESYEVGSLAISAGYLLTVTVPKFPASVDRALVYVGATSAVLYEQATAITTDEGTWTEPTGGYATGTDEPPSSNSLSETALVRFVEDMFRLTRKAPDHWQVSAVFEEAW